MILNIVAMIPNIVVAMTDIKNESNTITNTIIKNDNNNVDSIFNFQKLKF